MRCISSKGLVSRRWKELESNKKEASSKDTDRNFTKENIQMVISD